MFLKAEIQKQVNDIKKKAKLQTESETSKSNNITTEFIVDC